MEGIRRRSTGEERERMLVKGVMKNWEGEENDREEWWRRISYKYITVGKYTGLYIAIVFNGLVSTLALHTYKNKITNTVKVT